MKKRNVMVALFVLGFSLAVPTAVAACDNTCSCTYNHGGTNCSITKICSDGSDATCTCNDDGCVGSCHACGTNQIELYDFLGFGFNYSKLSGVRAGLASGTGWTVTQSVQSIDRKTDTYSGTLQEVIASVAATFGVCAEVNDTIKTINFKATGTCQ